MICSCVLKYIWKFRFRFCASAKIDLRTIARRKHKMWLILREIRLLSTVPHLPKGFMISIIKCKHDALPLSSWLMSTSTSFTISFFCILDSFMTVSNLDMTVSMCMQLLRNNGTLLNVLCVFIWIRHVQRRLDQIIWCTVFSRNFNRILWKPAAVTNSRTRSWLCFLRYVILSAWHGSSGSIVYMKVYLLDSRN